MIHAVTFEHEKALPGHMSARFLAAKHKKAEILGLVTVFFMIFSMPIIEKFFFPRPFARDSDRSSLPAAVKKLKS